MPLSTFPGVSGAFGVATVLLLYATRLQPAIPLCVRGTRQNVGNIKAASGAPFEVRLAASRCPKWAPLCLSWCKPVADAIASGFCVMAAASRLQPFCGGLLVVGESCDSMEFSRYHSLTVTI